MTVIRNFTRNGASIMAMIVAIGTALPAAAQTAAAPAPDVEQATPAPATQDVPSAVEPATDNAQSEERDIIVTGSRLSGGFSSPTPVSVVGTERLEQRGIANVADALNEVPAFRASNTPASGELNPSAGYVGGRILDLRGLGAVRTLTLVDGKRFVPSTTQATVDTNMIPSILLQRAEVVTGGASAQYGSDAVAGVANLILDHKLQGIKASAQTGITKYGDNSTQTLGLALGTRIGSTVNLVIGGEYEHSDGVGDCQARRFCRTEVLNFGRNPGYLELPANNILGDIRPSTVPFNGVTVPPTAAYIGRPTPLLRPIDGITFSPDGTPRRFQYGSVVNNLYMVGGEGEGQNPYFKDLFFGAPLERYAVTANIDWEATPDLTFSLMGNYGHLKSNYSATVYRNTAITIRNDNPFLPRSTDPTLDIPTLLSQGGLTSFQLGKGFVELGRPSITTTNDLYRIVASVKGTISPRFDWDAYYQYGRNEFRNDITNHTITARMLRAIDAVNGPAGIPVCRVNADADPNNNDAACVAYNPFGQQASQAARSYVTANGFQTNNTTQHVAAANLRGKLFDLPAGPVAVAIGGEYRSDSVEGDADALSQTLAFFSANGSRVSGKIEVVEGYAEGELPVFRDQSFANELSFNGAIRRTRYSRSSALVAGSNLSVKTYKYGGVYEPIPAIRFRATKSRDIRAPNVSELFGPTTAISGIVTDPSRGGAQTNPRIFSGSNAALRPERADTFTAGFVIKPTGGFLGRFRASVDYYEIKVDDAIATLGQQNIATRCFQGLQASCALIVRGPDGAITQVTDVLQNVNQIINRGIDAEITYRQPLGSLGELNFRLLSTYVKDFVTVDAIGPTERAGQTGLRGGTPAGLPDLVLDGLIGWTTGNFTLNAHGRFINKGFYNAAFIGAEQDGYDQTLVNSSNTNAVPSRAYLDILAQYKVDYGPDRAFTAFVGVDNVTNTEPPLNPGSHGTGNSIIFSPYGQTFKAGIRLNY
jgi:iron complex outermembrane receptor protein